MRNSIERYFPFLLLIFCLILFVVLALLSEGSIGGADDINHYRYSRLAFKNPEYLLHHWAKPVFTLIMAPVAQLGYQAIKIFNAILAVIAAFLTYRTARIMDLKYAWISILMLLFAPIYTLLAISGMTEILFSLFLIATVFSFYKKKYILSAVILSFIPMIRTEGIIFFPLWIIALVYVRSWKSIPFILTGSLLYSLTGWFVFNDFFWLINKMPYTGAQEIYGSGALLHFINESKFIFGIPLGIFLILAIIHYIRVPFDKNISLQQKTRQLQHFLLIVLPFAVYFAAHSYVWWKGLGGSLGLIRVIAAAMPLAAVMGVQGLQFILGFFHRFPWLRPGFTIIVAVFLTRTPFKVYSIPPEADPTRKLVRKASYWLVNSEYSGEKMYYFNPYFFHYMKLDRAEAPGSTLLYQAPEDLGSGIEDSSIFIWDAHFGPNEGRLPLENIMDHEEFKLIRSFKPDIPFRVLGDHPYAIYIFKKTVADPDRDNRDLLRKWTEHRFDQYRKILLSENQYDTEVAGPYPDSLITPTNEGFMFLNKEFLDGFEGTLPELYHDMYIEVSLLLHPTGTAINKEVYLIASLENRGKIHYYKSYPIKINTLEEKWNRLQAVFPLPEKLSENDILKVYLWNKERVPVYADDFRIQFLYLEEPGWNN